MSVSAIALLGDLAAAVHDDDAVADGEDVGQGVGDEDHRHALVAQLADQLEHLLLLGDAEVVGRLVHDHQLRVPVDGAGDGDRLALAAGEALDRLGERGEVDLERVERGARTRASIVRSSRVLTRPPR